jgi:hypothetical protein
MAEGMTTQDLAEDRWSPQGRFGVYRQTIDGPDFDVAPARPSSPGLPGGKTSRDGAVCHA